MGKALITGTAGMMGSHLAEALIEDGEAVVPTYFSPTIDIAEIASKMTLVELDVRDRVAVADLLVQERPGVIFHLAAQSLPTVSWRDPWLTLDTNSIGTVNVFEAVKRVREVDPKYDPCVVVACSSAEYGESLTPDRVPITEDAPLSPLHPYGVSKVAQDMLARQYWVNDHIRCIRARIFNCTGPRKRNDVVSDFAARVVRCLTSGEPIRVGNLDTRRSIVHVRDMNRALRLLATRGQPGEAYNICAEQVFSIREVLDAFLARAGKPLKWEVDPSLIRPSDEQIIFGSVEKLRSHTGWTQTLSLKDIIDDVLSYELAKAGITPDSGSSDAG